MDPKAAAVIAIDHGSRRTGFAVVDALRIAPQPLDVFHGPGDGDELLEHVEGLLEERTVGVFVVGVPYGPQGETGARANEVLAFAGNLTRRFPDIAVVRYDERLSTKAAEDLLREAGHHGRARRERRDSWSALVILRDWLSAGEPSS